ncbi:hypothetical protein LSAT2_007383 [Lamellibrachia satsuma]|nr:hypothetical protein LSAT2_007383 [Lamellibrachia satsuma]
MTGVVFLTYPTASTGSNCVTSCIGLADGDYQSCVRCNVYVTCSNGDTYDNRPCPAGLVWDDNVKRCEWTSPTCAVVKNGFFTMDLTDNDLGERYFNDPAWELLPGMPSLLVPPPNVSGSCDVPVFYKFSPPPCVKTVDVQMSINSSVTEYVFGVTDTNEFLYRTNATTVASPAGYGGIVGVDFDNFHSAGNIDLPKSDICIRVSQGAVSVSGQDVSKTFIGEMLFRRLQSAPLLLMINIDPYAQTPIPGICSLTVSWSC